MKKIVIYTDYNMISILFSLRPFFLFRNKGKFRFINKFDRLTNIKKYDNLLIVRKLSKLDKNELHQKFILLRKNYKKIAFYDDSSHALINSNIIEFVDYYFKGQFFKDINFYKNVNALSDYVRNNLTNLEPSNPFMAPVKDSDLKKIVLTWNLGVGVYPIKKNRIRITWRISKYINLKWLIHNWKIKNTRSNSNRKYINAMFKLRPVSRVTMLNQLDNNYPILKGSTTLKKYYKLLKKSFITLSPYGHGEICFRDFEAIISGSLLLKPNMNHLETYPDIFIPHETYIPLNRDFSNLNEKISDYYLKKETHRIIKKSILVYKNELSKLNKKVDQIMDLFIE